VELLELGELRESTASEVRIVAGGDFENGRLAGSGAGEGGNQAEDDVELERPEIDAVPLPKVFYIVARRSSEILRSIFLRAWIALRFLFALGFS
jgi:hypothetical protein